MAPNHRANDVIVLEDKPQILVARFMYGPLDMVSLSGEKVSNFNLFMHTKKVQIFKVVVNFFSTWKCYHNTG